MKIKLKLEAGLPKERIRAKLHYHSRQADSHCRALGFYLCEVADRKLYRDFAAPSAAVFAENELGIPRKTARELMRVHQKLKKLRRIARAFDKGKIAWSKVREITRVATAKTEKEWLRFATEKPVGEVETEVSRSKKGDPPGRTVRPPRPVFMVFKQRLSAATFQVVDAAQAKVMDVLGKGTTPEQAWEAIGKFVLENFPENEEQRKAGGKGRSAYTVVFHVSQDCREAWMWGTNGRIPIPLEAALRMATDNDVITARDIEEPQSLYTIQFGEAGTVPPEERDPEASEAMRAIVLARDGHRCQVCGHTKNLNVHHLEARANGGKTRVEFLLVLCVCCHENGHSGLLKLRFTEDGGLIALDKDEKPIVKTGGAAETLEELSKELPDHVMEECPLTVIEADEQEDVGEEEEETEEDVVPEPAPVLPEPSLDYLPAELTAEQWKELEPCVQWDRWGKHLSVRPGAVLPDFCRPPQKPDSAARKAAGASESTEASPGKDLQEKNGQKRGETSVDPGS